MQHFQDDRPIFSLGEKRNVSYQPGALEITCHPQPLFPTMHVLIKSSHCQALFAFPSKLSPLIMSDSAWELFIYKHTISSISLSLSSLIDETLGGHGEWLGWQCCCSGLRQCHCEGFCEPAQAGSGSEVYFSPLLVQPSGLCPELLLAGGGTLQPCSRAVGIIFLSWLQQQEGSLRRAAALHLQANNVVVWKLSVLWSGICCPFG